MLTFFLLLVVVVVLSVIALVIVGRLMVRNQRKMLVTRRQNGVAFLCRPKLGMLQLAGYVLSVDHDTVALWKVGLRKPARTTSFPSLGATVGPVPVRINVARTSPGLSVVSASDQRIDVVIFPDPTMSYSTPTDGALLELVCDRIRETLQRGSAATTPN